MSKQPRKKKRITVGDVGRAARKLQEEKDGLIEISDFSTPALSEIALRFEDQYKDGQRRAGSVNKKKQGIWLATLDLLARDPAMTPRQAWDALKTVDLMEWVLDIEDGKLFMRYEGDDPILRQRKNPKPILFNAYRTEYVYKVRKELGITVK